MPLTATNWQVEVEFSINGQGSLFGDGFAMWVTKNRAQQGDVFGMQDKFEGLGIFFDTYKNNRPGVVFPYVMAMLGDGQTAYDKHHDGKANELAGCSVFQLAATLPLADSLTSLLSSGTWCPQRKLPYQSSHHLFRGKVSPGRTDVQEGRRMDKLLRSPGCEAPFGHLPRFLRRDRRAFGQSRHHQGRDQEPLQPQWQDRWQAKGL